MRPFYPQKSFRLRDFGLLCCLLAVTVFICGCGIKIKHQVEGNAKVDTGDKIDELVNKLKDGLENSSQNLRGIAKDLNASINEQLGPDAQGSVNNLPSNETKYDVTLDHDKDGNLALWLDNSNSQAIHVDFEKLTLETQSGVFVMFRNHSTDNEFHWWYRLEDSSAFAEVYLVIDESAERLSGYVKFYQ